MDSEEAEELLEELLARLVEERGLDQEGFDLGSVPPSPPISTPILRCSQCNVYFV